ncbi:hypothetical protein GJ496_005552 [Pomphorhynchus laevis]|nr:hypothetical protein GJ496_005552 [Pomphorhynchus laevis]
MASTAQLPKQTKMDDKEAQKTIEQIDEVQTQLDRLNEMASEEILKVEIKYNKQRQPHYKKRAELISKISHFWVTVFINHPQLSALIEPEDEAALQYLRTIDIDDSEDIRSGYAIKFHFDKNPYFENDLLIKEFNISDTCEASSKSTTIKWKPGKNFTQKDARDSRKRHRDECFGFFAWFTDSVDAGADEIGELIKDDIYINPLQYFLVTDADGLNNADALGLVNASSGDIIGNENDADGDLGEEDDDEDDDHEDDEDDDEAEDYPDDDNEADNAEDSNPPVEDN